MKITTLGIDLAKRVFQLHGVDQHGKCILRKRLSRSELVPFMANLPPCRVGMEVCGGANYWSRRFRTFGHEVRLMSPQFVKPYVKTNKNDYNDAEAICEAVSRHSSLVESFALPYESHESGIEPSQLTISKAYSGLIPGMGTKI